MKVEFVQGIGKDSGKEYYRLDVTIVDGVTKMVFLSPAEVQLLLLSGIKPKIA